MELVEGTAVVDDVDAFVAALSAVGEEFGCAVQAFDARLVAGADHLRAAVERADRARERGENVARDPAVEILLYAAGRRQIDRALAMGLDEGETPAVVVVHGVEPGADEAAAADAVRERLDPGPALDRRDEARIREFFGVTPAELSATDADLSELVRERVALLDVEK